MAQSTELFVRDLRPQRAWGASVALDLFLEGAGAGLFFLAVMLHRYGFIADTPADVGAWAGLVAAGAGTLFLFAHLGVRRRFLNVFRRPRTSWMSRGAYIVTVFGIFGFVALLPSIPGLEGLPWEEGTAAGTILRSLALVFAMLLMAYTGLVLSSWPSIPFWNTPLLPLLFIANSLLAGGAVLLMLGAIVEADEITSRLKVLTLALSVGNGFGLLFYLMVMASATAPARESVRRLLRGEQRWAFLLGLVGIGILLPVLFLALETGGLLGSGTAEIVILVLGGLAVLTGGVVLRDVFLRVGVYGYPV
ncbi:MAG: dimethyl sulfoxide reductase anchor subunit [Dehalococcoidia bacterium]|nr:dimethyl sulfoxide reductase anchor subunit [Dehalococcoidia bacterium]MDP7510520.1 dimethyl sulfoxide reductase anchor subunit [Dehalococcoidia bacterium]HJN87102.1 DmsC/YnfH family molybdoenzyme membrane anchor subunit [Dehalococcoidia bacterium]